MGLVRLCMRFSEVCRMLALQLLCMWKNWIRICLLFVQVTHRAVLFLNWHLVEIRAVPDYVCLRNTRLLLASGFIMVTSRFILFPYHSMRWGRMIFLVQFYRLICYFYVGSLWQSQELKAGHTPHRHALCPHCCFPFGTERVTFALDRRRMMTMTVHIRAT